jgi:lipoate-protein ligase A
MSVDHALLSRAKEGVAFLRLYRWAPPCLSFGRNEPATVRYDREDIERLGLATVRRPTGGRAVWHDAEVTYAVAAPNSTFGSLQETYNIIHATLAFALRRLGIPAQLAGRSSSRTGSLNSGACFAAPAGGEVVVAGRKLVGSAQLREGQSFLQHGSILLEDGQDIVARVIRGEHMTPAATSISAELGRAVGFAELAAAIRAEVVLSWPGNWYDSDAPVIESDLGRFADPAWTWRR